MTRLIVVLSAADAINDTQLAATNGAYKGAMRTLVWGSIIVIRYFGRGPDIDCQGLSGGSGRIPKSSLVVAQSVAMDLARTGGITLVWAEPDQPCDFVFMVKYRKSGAKKTILGKTVLGEPHTSVYSYIYFNQILSTVLGTTCTAGLSQAIYSATPSLMNWATC